MKVRDLKKKMEGMKDKDMDADIVCECEHEKHHVLFAKKTNYNKRDMKFTSKIFLIQTIGGQ